MSKNSETGRLGETLAAAYLEKQAWQILHRNWRAHPHEIDLIACKAEVLIFVEVKTFSTKDQFVPESRVSKKQFSSIGKAASAYLNENPFEGEIRFDVLYVELNDSSEISHFKDVWFPNNWGR